MRKLPPEVQAWQTNPDGKRIIMTREYRLLTPLFGGGVKVGEVDEETPIHGTGIRGQLRFWWRATRGSRYSSPEQLKAAEDSIWGSTNGGSQIALAVVEANRGNVLTLPNNQHGEEMLVGDVGSPYSYVAFPLRDAQGKVHEKVSFRLQISLPGDDKNLVTDLQAALWAWETFGGVGARTRRGFGAIECTNVTSQSSALSQDEAEKSWRWRYHSALVAGEDLAKKAEGYALPGTFAVGVPHLSSSDQHYKTTRPQSSAMEVWEQLLSSLKRFRQNRINGQYGRSNWPEPDAIRRITNSYFIEQVPDDSEKEPRDYTEPVHSSHIDRFPRAAFGLPIIFEFKDGPDESGDAKRDPRKTTLTLKDHSRLGSPLVIRPLPCRDGVYVGIAVILQGSGIPKGQLVLKEMNGDAIQPVNADLTSAQAREINRLHSANITPDILQSFLDSLS